MPEAADSLRIPESWRQGAILPSDLLPEGDEGRIGIAVSHSCDLANPSLEKEPTFEWIAAERIPKPDNYCLRGRNPRQLDLEGPPPLRLSMADRRWGRREILASIQPAGHLGQAEIDLVSEWMARRYQRVAFPTAFNKRRASIANKVRTKLGTQAGRDMLGLWIALSTDDELPDSEPYLAHLMATVADDLSVGSRNAVETLLFEIGDKLGECEGIEIADTPGVALESEVTITILNRYARMEDWDDLSRG